MKQRGYAAAKERAKARFNARAGKATGATVSGSKAAGTTQVSAKSAGALSFGGFKIVPGDIIEVDASVLARAVNEERSIKVLGAAMAAAPQTVSPELARSLQAQENWWRKIDHEFPSLNSREVAALLGASSTNRNFASQQRRAGKLLGYARRNAALFPAFQFDQAKGSVRAVIPQLIEMTRRYEVPDEDVVLWMATPSTLFFPEQDRPVDHLDDPEALLAAAESHFGAIW